MYIVVLFAIVFPFLLLGVNKLFGGPKNIEQLKHEEQWRAIYGHAKKNK